MLLAPDQAQRFFKLHHALMCFVNLRLQIIPDVDSPERFSSVAPEIRLQVRQALLDKPHTRPMVMQGRELEGWLRVDPDGLRTKRQLTTWVKRGVNHARSLTPK